MIAFDEEIAAQQSIVDYKKIQKQRKVLALLYAEKTCTLAQLARNLHSSIPSVTSLVEDLIDTNWVSPIGTAVGSNGRRPVLFGLNTNYHYVAVVDMNTHDTRILFMNTQGEVVFRGVYGLPLGDNLAFLSSLTDYFSMALSVSGLRADDLIAVGLSMPGLIDGRSGLNLTYRNLTPANTSLTQLLADEFGKPVYLINDTRAMALGESRFGGGKGKKQVLALNLDWGVGMGIVVNGEVMEGASGFAGELGHIQIDPEGELCYCGKIGCLNTLTSASALVRRVQRDIEAGEVSILATYQSRLPTIGIDEIIDAAHNGDAYAIDRLYETGFLLGKGLAIAISLFNPEVIIIDGVLSRAGDFILNTIEQAVGKHCLSEFRSNLTIELTQLNGTARWLGTHAYVMEDIFARY